MYLTFEVNTSKVKSSRRIEVNYEKYQGVKEFHMLACVGCCNIMVLVLLKLR